MKTSESCCVMSQTRSIQNHERLTLPVAIKIFTNKSHRAILFMDHRTDITTDNMDHLCCQQRLVYLDLLNSEDDLDIAHLSTLIV